MVKVAPSILAADFANLAADVARVAADVDLLHVDCMDGHYVPNLSIGPPVVASLRPHTDLFLDCHLMVDNPETLLRAFADAGADGLTVHIELGDPRPLLDEIGALGVRRGLAFEPDTPLDAVAPYLGDIDLLLVMSVHTGFGGQPFIPEVLDKVRAARKEIEARGLDVEIEIDGGIKIGNAAVAAEAGVDILVSGTGIFGADDPAAAARDTGRRIVTLRAKVLTVSDGVAEGTRDDKSGRALADRMVSAGYEVVDHRVCADGVEPVAAALRELARDFAGLVVTTGGTGFGPRDLTPEGTRVVIEREAPGIAEAIRRASDSDGRGFGMLSRGVAGTVGQTLICNLPGSTGGAVEGFDILASIAAHALDLLAGGHPH